MKFVYLLGSLRKESINAILAEQLRQLSPVNVEVEALGSIRNIPHYDADLQAEGFPLEIRAMGDAIRKADAVVLVTPEYNYSVPGALKNTIDWLSRLPNQPFAGKPVSIITASPGRLGGARVQYHLRQIFVFLDAKVLNKPEVFVGMAAEKIDASKRQITDEETRSLLTQHLKALYEMVSEATGRENSY